MIVYPAIDIKDGVCVRLEQGDFNRITAYNTDPVQQALMYQKAGAEYIHIVDLDGAKNGAPQNIDVIKKVVQAISIPVQVGGGIRDEKTIATLLDMGVSRVILGTKATEDIVFLEKMIQNYPQKIVVSVDVKNGFVATDGWLVTSTISAIDFCKLLVIKGVTTIVYTDISKDGMMQGIETQFYQELKETLAIEVVASGGVSTIEDIKKLQVKGIDGAIIGKALYLKNIQLEEAIRVARGKRDVE